MKKILVDIDGTIAKVGDQLKFLLQEPKDWDSFYEACFDDEPIKKIIDLVDDLAFFEYNLVFCTGRRESVREKTLLWLFKYFPFQKTSEIVLLMRKNDDKRHDVEVKPELLEESGIKLDDIYMVFEDRTCMCKKWRELGLTCLQVAEGDF